MYKPRYPTETNTILNTSSISIMESVSVLSNLQQEITMRTKKKKIDPLKSALSIVQEHMVWRTEKHVGPSKPHFISF